MAGTDVSRTRYSGLLVPDQRCAAWAAESSYTQAGPRPGVPDPSNVTDAVLATSGTMSANASYMLLSQRGGFPGATAQAARFVWKNTSDASTLYRGWLPGQAQMGWESPVRTDGAATVASVRQSDAVALANGTVVAVAEVEDTLFATTQYRVEAIIRNVATDTWARTTIYSQSTSPTQRYCPCAVVLPSGRILCYITIADSTTTNIRMMFSDDSGASWSFGADAVLGTDIVTSTDTVQRVRAAYSNGQILMVIWVTKSSGVREQVYQYASSDFGHNFSKVTLSTATGDRGFPDLVVLPTGEFVFIYIVYLTANWNFRSRILANAYQPFTSVSAVEATFAYDIAGQGASVFNAGELSATIDEHGVIYVYVQHATNRHGIVFVSSDNAQSWNAIGSSGAGGAGTGVWWDTTTTTDYPTKLEAVAWRGCVLLLHDCPDSAGIGFGGSLGCVYLGGYTTVTLPLLDRFSSEDELAAWEDHWIPIAEPATLSWTANGAGTDTIESPGRMLVSTSANTRYYSRAPTATVAQGMIVRFRLVVPSGGDFTTNQISVLLRLADGAQGYLVELKFQSTGWRMYDAQSGVQIGNTVSSSMTGPGQEIMVGIAGDEVASWYRPYTNSPAKSWTAGPATTSLTNAAAAYATNAIEWGHRVNATVDSYWYEFCHSAGQYSGASQWSDGFTNPTDLVGRNFSARPVYVDGGFSIAMTDGPTFAGDTWTIATRYDYAITNALDVPSPRKTWRSTSTAEQTIAIRIDDSLGDDVWTERTLLGLALLNTNISRFVLWGYTGGAWASLGTVNTYSGMGAGLRFIRDGNTVRPDTAQPSTQLPYLKHNEHQGATFSYSTSAGRRIARHSEGAWRRNNETRLRPVVVLEDVDAGDSANGAAGAIVPRDVVVLLDLAATAYQAFKIVIPTTVAGTHPAPAESYYEIGTLVLGSVYAFGQDYDWSRTIDTEAGVEIAESRDRTKRSRVAAPPRRTVEIAWAEGAVDLTNVSSDTADPDFVIASTDTNAEPNASAFGTPTVLDGLVYQLDGPHRPVVYLPNFDKSSGLRILNRREEIVYGRLEQPLRLEVVQGTELTDEVQRVATGTLVEEK
jgi:hypothetical protein